jgi:hypothetical protein
VAVAAAAAGGGALGVAGVVAGAAAAAGRARAGDHHDAVLAQGLHRVCEVVSCCV